MKMLIGLGEGRLMDKQIKEASKRINKLEKKLNKLEEILEERCLKFQVRIEELEKLLVKA